MPLKPPWSSQTEGICARRKLAITVNSRGRVTVAGKSLLTIAQASTTREVELRQVVAPSRREEISGYGRIAPMSESTLLDLSRLGEEHTSRGCRGE